jgi:hypothetical protein
MGVTVRTGTCVRLPEVGKEPAGVVTSLPGRHPDTTTRRQEVFTMDLREGDVGKSPEKALVGIGFYPPAAATTHSAIFTSMKAERTPPQGSPPH